MRDDDLDENLDDVPPDDSTSFLDRLDAEADFEDVTAPDGQPLSPAPLSRREVDDLVDRVLTEELARLSGGAAKKKD
jgi:hypothetical protein